MAKKSVDLYNTMLRNIEIFERYNQQKYQIVYKYSSQDYNQFYMIVNDIIAIVGREYSWGYKAFGKAFFQLFNSLTTNFFITRHQSYEKVQFGVDGIEIDENEFNKGLSK